MDFYDSFKGGYNLAPLAGSNIGVKLSEETKRKMSISFSTRTISDEHKKKISIAHKGKKFSKDRRINMSIAHMGYKPTEEHRKNHLASLNSPETKKKMSISAKKAYFRKQMNEVLQCQI